MSALAIINCDIYTPGDYIPRGLVLIDGAKIRAVGRSPDIPLPIDTRLLDAEGGRITPGLIDLARPDAMPSPAEESGVTGYLLSIRVMEEADFAAVARAAAIVAQTGSKARALGLHVVGPWLPGGDPSIDWRDLWAVSDGTVRMITLDPDAGTDQHTMAALLAHGVSLALAGGGVRARWMFEQEQAGRVALCGDSSLEQASADAYKLASIEQLRADSTPTIAHLILTGSRDQPLAGNSIRKLMALTNAEFPTALACVTSHPADLLGLELGRLAPGAAADMICWTRYGDIAWTMVAGQIVYPCGGERRRRAVPLRIDSSLAENKRLARALRQQAFAEIGGFLRDQADTLEVRNVTQEPAYQERYIDLIWRFRAEAGREQIVTIALCVDARSDGEDLALAVADTSRESPCYFLQTEADWLFYYFAESHRLYCLPVHSTRAWYLEHENATHSPEAAPTGRSVPIHAVMTALPRARALQLTPPPHAD